MDSAQQRGKIYYQIYIFIHKQTYCTYKRNSSISFITITTTYFYYYYYTTIQLKVHVTSLIRVLLFSYVTEEAPESYEIEKFSNFPQ